MAKRKPRRIVIDASVARASGPPDAVHPTGQQCRACLTQVLQICHHVVMTEALRGEWGRHQSRFARGWLLQMYSRRKVAQLDVAEDGALRRQVSESVAHADDTLAMLKDCHLLEAALATDRIVLSLDESARGLFADFSAHHDLAGRVVWVNPTQPNEQSETWLADGARAETARTLAATRRNKRSA
jgi:hypothetical protein